MAEGKSASTSSHDREYFRIERSPRRQILTFGGLGLDPVRLLGRYRYISASRELVAHSHGEMIEICLLESGRQTYEVSGQEYSLAGGDLFVTFPGESHGSGKHPEERGVLYWLLLSVPAARTSFLNLPPREGRALLDRLLRMPRRCFRGSHILTEILSSIFQHRAAARDPLRVTAIRTLLLRFLLEVAASAYMPLRPSCSWQIHAALSHIDSTLDRPLPLAELARVAKLSLPRFKAKFKTEVGVPPADYIARRKVERATRLLVETDRPVTDIAYEMGFSSSQNFATVFKRYTHLSPREARLRKPRL